MEFPPNLKRWALGPALMFMAGGGCVDGVVVHSDIAYALDIQSQLDYATAGYQMKTRIYGNPFSGPKESFVIAVTAAMRGSNPGVPATFSTDPKTNMREPYHVVVQFNPPVSLEGDDLCGNVAQSNDDPSPAKLRITAAFCFGDQILSEVQGSVTNVAGPNDPRFQFLIHQVTRFLFPPDELQGDDSPRILQKT